MRVRRGGKAGWLVLAALGAGLLPTQPTRGAATNDYYPLTAGSRWTYAVTDYEHDSNRYEQVAVVDPTQVVDGVAYPVLRQTDRRGTMRAFVIKDERGVFWQHVGACKAFTPEARTTFTPAAQMLSFPLVRGRTWDWAGELRIAWIKKRIRMHCEIVDDAAELTVPAGTFRCVHVHIRDYRDAEASEEDAWYAPGIGQVKFATRRTCKELKTWDVK